MRDVILFNLQNNNGVYYSIFWEFWFCQTCQDTEMYPLGIREFIEYKNGVTKKIAWEL